MAATDLVLVDGDSKKPLKLISFELHVRLESFLSETTATMSFYNETDKVLDGELLFPLPENGYVTGYSLDMNGILVDGVIVSKQDGRVAFETTGGNNSCGMIEQAVGNVYKTRVYPVPPKGSRTIKIVFCSELKVNWTQQNRTLTWNFPGNIPQTKLQTFSIDITIGATTSTPTMTTLSPELRNFPKLSYNHQDHCYEASYRAQDFTLSGQLLQLEAKTNSKLFIVEPAKEGYYFAIADSFADNSHAKQLASGTQTINVIWDCSFSQRGNLNGSQMYFHVLSKLFNSFPNAIFHITQLRNDIGPVSQFRADQQDQAMTLLLGLIYDGGTDFQKLNLKREQIVKIDGKELHTNYSFFVLFSNGVNTLGDENIKINSQCPLHSFSTEESANHDFLKKISASSGGTYTNLDKSTPANFSVASLLKSINNEQSLFKNVNHKDFELEAQDSPKFDTRLIPHLKNIPLPSNHYVTVVGWIPALPTGSPALELEYGTTIVKSKKLVRTFWAKKRIAELLEDELNEEQMVSLPCAHVAARGTSRLMFVQSSDDLGVLSLWDRRLQWWQGADEHKAQPHFRDFSLPIPNDLWESPGPDYEFLQFNDELNRWKQQQLEPRPEPEPLTDDQKLVDAFRPKGEAFIPFEISTPEPKPTYFEPESIVVVAPPAPEPQDLNDYDEDLGEDEWEDAEPAPEPELQTEPTKAGALRKGQRVVVDGKELTIYDMSTSKTGKHGGAKIHFTMMDEDGKKVEQLMPSTWNVDKAVSPARAPKKKYIHPFASSYRDRTAPAPAPAARQSSSDSSKSTSTQQAERKTESKKESASPVPSVSASSSASVTSPQSVSAGLLQTGDTVIIDGKKIKLVSISKSKTGKHGAAKAHFVAIDEDGKKIEQLLSTTHKIEKLVTTKEEEKPEKTNWKSYESVQPQQTTYRTYEKITDENCVFASLPDTNFNRTEFQKFTCHEHGSSMSVQILQWKSESEWMQQFLASKKDRFGPVVDYYLSYLSLRPKFGHMFSFYFDVASFFFSLNSSIAYRILSSIAEIDLSNPHYLRIIARKLLEHSAFIGTAIQIFETVLAMRPEEPISYLDLCVALQRLPKFNMSVDGHRAMKLMNHVIKGVWPEIKFERYNQIEVIFLMEMNRLANEIRKFNMTQNYVVDTSFVDPRLINLHIPVDLRIVLHWHDGVDIELHVVDPNDERCFSFHNRTALGGLLSADTTGYGPEEFVLRDARPGTYRVLAKVFHTTRNNPSGTVVTLTVYSNFGRTEQKSSTTSVRMVQSKEQMELALITVK